MRIFGSELKWMACFMFSAEQRGKQADLSGSESQRVIRHLWGFHNVTKWLITIWTWSHKQEVLPCIATGQFSRLEDEFFSACTYFSINNTHTTDARWHIFKQIMFDFYEIERRSHDSTPLIHKTSLSIWNANSNCSGMHDMCHIVNKKCDLFGNVF